MNYSILKAGNTGRAGAQFGNDNASKSHLNLVEENSNATLQNYDMLRDEFTKGLSKDDRISLNRYAGTGYLDINPWLRTKQTVPGSVEAKYLRPIVAHLHSLLKPLPVDAVVYRGIHSDASKRLKTGDIFKDLAFTSTTIDSNATHAFRGDKGTVFRIHVPAGTPVAFPERNKFHNKDEREIVLAPGTHFKVLEGGGGYIHLQVMPTLHKR